MVCKGCLDLRYSCSVLFIVKKEVLLTLRRKDLTKEEIKQQLIDSLINSDKIGTEEINKKANKVEKSHHYKRVGRNNTYKKEKTLYALHIIKGNILEDSKRRKVHQTTQ